MTTQPTSAVTDAEIDAALRITVDAYGCFTTPEVAAMRQALAEFAQSRASDASDATIAQPEQPSPYGPRPVFGAIGTRDIDVAAAQKAWDEAQPSQALEFFRAGCKQCDRQKQADADNKEWQEGVKRGNEIVSAMAHAAINAKGTK